MTVELVNAETGELVDSLTEAEARRLTERIRVALDRVSTAWADLAERITEAYQRRADLALGYRSWAEYAEAELKPSEGLAADVRRQLVGMLSAQGMSTRAIAPTVGAPRETVRRDISKLTHGGSPEPKPAAPTTYAAAAPASVHPVPLTPGAEVTIQPLNPQPGDKPITGTVVGLDGKTYTRPEPKTPPRRPLRDGFRDAALDLDKLVRRFESLAGDDRLPRNKNEVARYANDLTRAINALQRVADQLT